MLKAIFAAIANGFRLAWSMGFSFLLWPFLAFSRPAPAGTIGHKLDAVKAVEKSIATSAPKPPDISDSLKRDAQIAWSCIAVAMVTKQPLQFPSAMSKKMRGWLAGLDLDQLEKLHAARTDGILAHFGGKILIPGVPATQTLPPVELRFPPAAIRKSDIPLSDFQFSLR